MLKKGRTKIARIQFQDCFNATTNPVKRTLVKQRDMEQYTMLFLHFNSLFVYLHELTFWNLIFLFKAQKKFSLKKKNFLPLRTRNKKIRFLIIEIVALKNSFNFIYKVAF